MKELVHMLLVAFLVFVPISSASAIDQEEAVEIGRSTDQARQMEEELEKVQKESDARKPAGEYSVQAGESMDGAPGAGDQ